MTPTPSENLRKHINTRTRKTVAQLETKVGSLNPQEKKSPSQKHSEAMRKKLNRGVVPPVTIGYDCNNCLKYPCGETTRTCKELTRKNRCGKCGMVVVYRFVAEGEWKYCLPCREGFK